MRKKIKNHLIIVSTPSLLSLSSTLFLSQELFLLFCLILTPSQFLLLLNCPPPLQPTPTLYGVFGVCCGAILNPL